MVDSSVNFAKHSSSNEVYLYIVLAAGIVKLAELFSMAHEVPN